MGAQHASSVRRAAKQKTLLIIARKRVERFNRSASIMGPASYRDRHASVPAHRLYRSHGPRRRQPGRLRAPGRCHRSAGQQLGTWVSYGAAVVGIARPGAQSACRRLCWSSWPRTRISANIRCSADSRRPHGVQRPAWLCSAISTKATRLSIGPGQRSHKQAQHATADGNPRRR